MWKQSNCLKVKPFSSNFNKLLLLFFPTDHLLTSTPGVVRGRPLPDLPPPDDHGSIGLNPRLMMPPPPTASSSSALASSPSLSGSVNPEHHRAASFPAESTRWTSRENLLTAAQDEMGAQGLCVVYSLFFLTLLFCS